MAFLKSELPTPALLLDLDKFEANVARLHGGVAAAGKQLRPHAKSHKCAKIAERQVQAGAVGVCVATLAEMELMASAGIGALLTTPVAFSAKTDRVAALAAGGANVRAVVDNPFHADLYQASAARAGTTLNILVDLDVGDHRTGMPCDERAIALAMKVDASPNLRFCGVQAYAAGASHTQGLEARQAHSRSALAPAVAIRQELLRRGLDANTFTGGSTGTWDVDITIPEVTEIQAGSYALMDVDYLRIGGADFAPAMTLVATVISANHPDRVTLDAGFKSLATDKPFGPEPIGLTGVRWSWAGDEHGYLHMENPSRTLRLGDRIELITPHCDPTVNLHDRIFACRGDRVEEIFPLKRLSLPQN